MPSPELILIGWSLALLLWTLALAFQQTALNVYQRKIQAERQRWLDRQEAQKRQRVWESRNS